jgi:hypothetical protein
VASQGVQKQGQQLSEAVLTVWRRALPSEVYGTRSLFKEVRAQARPNMILIEAPYIILKEDALLLSLRLP